MNAKASEEATAWHRRFAAAANNRAWDRASYGLALAAIEAVSNEEEQGIVARTFSRVPKP